MLTDEIKKTIKSLKQLDTIESAVQDAEKKQKNDIDFSSLVIDFTTSMAKLSAANKQLEFKLSDETMQYVEESIEKLESVISASVVDEAELVTAKQHISRKVNPNLAKEWKNFHQKKTAGLSAKLSSMGGLVQDPNQIVTIKSNINNGNDWNKLSLKDDGVHTRLELLCEGIDQVDQLEQGLNLSDDIKDFVVKVTSGKAKITDINQKIIDWIVDEDLVEKFVINFKNS
ncbi:hypothetical protein [Agathobacter rectalis]|uniref:hypothetical protein n=1 Tax=Agathobacter rectalis TaxID=39491 RepID=UPI001105D386|nr:hypothetical protein [Agathobacter rectalis]